MKKVFSIAAFLMAFLSGRMAQDKKRLAQEKAQREREEAIVTAEQEMLRLESDIAFLKKSPASDFGGKLVDKAVLTDSRRRLRALKDFLKGLSAVA